MLHLMRDSWCSVLVGPPVEGGSRVARAGGIDGSVGLKPGRHDLAVALWLPEDLRKCPRRMRVRGGAVDW